MSLATSTDTVCSLLSASIHIHLRSKVSMLSFSALIDIGELEPTLLADPSPEGMAIAPFADFLCLFLEPLELVFG